MTNYYVTDTGSDSNDGSIGNKTGELIKHSEDNKLE